MTTVAPQLAAHPLTRPVVMRVVTGYANKAVDIPYSDIVTKETFRLLSTMYARGSVVA